MLIRVMYLNYKYDIVKTYLLDQLIISGKIKKFYRSDGWAVIGRDPVRIGSGIYKGEERRKSGL